MSVQRGRLGVSNCYHILKKYWGPKIGENVRNVKPFKDGMGVVFDIRSDNMDAFLENFERLKETGDRIDFDVAKCSDLPDLDEDASYGGNQNWRDSGNNGGYGQRGGYRQGGYGGRGGGYHQQDRDNGWANRGPPRNNGYGGNQRDWANRRDDYGDENGGSGWGRGGDGYQRRGQYSGGYGGQDFRPRTAGVGGNAPTIASTQSKMKQGASEQVVYVTNLKFQVTEQDLMDFFKDKGFEPVRARLLYDQQGNSKGTGFVEMGSPGEAQDAASRLHNEYLQGRKLYVNMANQRE